MKRLTTLMAGLLIGTAVHAQSYMVRTNGVVLTVDEKGFVYDLNQFILPYMITAKGGMFYVSDKRVITTVDEKGFFYRLDPRQYEAPRKVEHVGYNYFLEGNGRVWSFDRNGLPTVGERNWDYRKPLYVGGKFFVVEGGRREPAILVVINDQGAVTPTQVAELDPAKITDSGTNWFVDSKRRLFTLNADGQVGQALGVGPVGNILAKGGNFLVMDGKLLTVTEDARVNDAGSVARFGTIAKLGHNYFITADNRLFVVDVAGTVVERTGVADISNVALTTL